MEVARSLAQRALALPHALVLMFAAIVLACVATWVLPAGAYARAERVLDNGQKLMTVVPNSYAALPRSPVGPLGLLSAIQHGMIDAADLIFFVFLVGAAFATIERTGAIEAGLSRLIARLGSSSLWVIVPISILFSLGGATFGMSEETIAFVPMCVLLARRLGLDKASGVALCFGAATVGFAFAPLNPFSVGMAHRFAELPLFSGMGFRLVFYLIATALFLVHFVRYAKRHSRQEKPPAEEADAAADSDIPVAWLPVRHSVVWIILALTVVTLAVGVTEFGWYMRELTMLFLAAGIVAGLAGGLGASGTAESFVRGFKDIAFAALMIGFARSIKVVLEQGNVIDSVVHGLFTPLAGLPPWLGGVGMFFAHAMLHLAIPSSSGQATVTMPIVVPLAELLGLTRQTAVLAFQYGMGVTNFVWPTQATLVAVLGTAALPFDRWMRFILPFVLQIAVLGIIAVLIAEAITLGPA